jgi:hypothetical protein
MAVAASDLDVMPVVPELKDFDQNSGNALERLVFNHRLWLVIACALVTVILGYFAATKLTLNASFEKMMPQSQPYIKNYLDNRSELRGLGNALRIVVENTQGDIFDPKYLDSPQARSTTSCSSRRRRPGLDEVAVDALRALDGSDRGGLPGRPGGAGRLRRFAEGRRVHARSIVSRSARSAEPGVATTSRA